MSARVFLLRFSATALLASAASLTAATGEPAKGNSSPAPAAPAESAKPAAPVLTKGMTADEVIRAIGRPTAVEPMDTKEGKAEKWIYRRKAGLRYEEVPTGQRQVPAFVGAGPADSSVKTRTEIIYTKKRVQLYQVTSLLMFNGQLVVAKQAIEHSNDFE